MSKIKSWKKKGDDELHSGNYHQAWKCYTNAIHLLEDIYNIDENYGLKINNSIFRQEASIFSKRSVTFLKMKQYYYAYEDAKHIIDIYPEWYKGKINFFF